VHLVPISALESSLQKTKIETTTTATKQKQNKTKTTKDNSILTTSLNHLTIEELSMNELKYQHNGNAAI